VTEYSTGTNSAGEAKTIADSEKAQVQITELALYDKDGNNLIEKFKQKTPITQFAFEGGDARIMEPGEAALGNLGAYGCFTHQDQVLENLFDGSYGKTATGNLSGSSGGIRQDDPKTWLPIVVRLPDDAPEAVRLDFACGRNRDGDIDHAGSYNGRNPTAFRLDASADGINWDIAIAANPAIVVPEIYPKWDSEPDKKIAYDVRKDKGTVISDAEVKSGNAYAFSSVGAANGATVTVDGEPIEINGLRVDASQGSGNIENVILAENGTVEVVNFDTNMREISFPVNVAGLSESGVSAWKVNINGKPSSWKCAVTKDGKIRITPAGVYLIVR
jgi:hypothetical protein